MRKIKLNMSLLESERKRLEMTKEYFAKHIGIKPTAYCYLLKEKSTSLNTIAKIAFKLKRYPKDLLI